jgi:hypothetical protein
MDYLRKSGLTVLFILAISPITNLSQVEFEMRTLVGNGAEWWWARSHADVNNDGLLDFFVINNNAHGGWLGWFETTPELEGTIKHIIAEKGPHGGTFGAGDLASADIDNDGDIDVLGPESPGEWGGADKPTNIYWYENPSWKPHFIGTYPSLIKDFDLADFDNDGKVDLAGTSHHMNSLVVFKQNSSDSWSKVADIYVKQLHEGQHVGDLDGDGDTDIVSTGFWFVNPGGDLTENWEIKNIDPFWNSDTGTTWEYNATKIICVDIDNDKMDEVFISCSEKFRDRIAWYDLLDPDNNKWEMHLIGKNSFAHTLQVGDFDLDGDFDVLSGNNAHQGDPENSPVILFINKGNNVDWKEQTLTLTGGYNSYIGDVEGDGDLDIFRYEGHESKFYEVWINLTIK